MAAGDGLRIPIVLDFSDSIRNAREFRAAIGQAFSEIGLRAQSAADSGVPYTPRQVTGAIGRQAGIAQAQASRAGLTAEDTEAMFRFVERQVTAQVAQMRRMPGYEDVREPTAAQIQPTLRAEQRRIDAAQAEFAAQSVRSAENQEEVAQATAGQAAAARRAERAQQQNARASETRTGIPGGDPLAGFGYPQGIPSAENLSQMRATLAAQIARLNAGQGNVFSQLGEQAGLQRTFGLNTALATERDPTFRSPENRETRLQVTIERRIRELEERSDVEQALIRNERDLLQQTAQLAVTLEQRQLAQRAAARAQAGDTLDEPRARERLGAELDRGRVTERVAEITTPEDIRELGRASAAAKARREQIERAAISERRANVELVKETALTAAARKREQQAINAQANRELQASLRPEERGSMTQRAQAFIAARQGGPPRLPTEFLNARQLFASRAITTASFAASGALMYGGVQFVRELISEASELEVQLGIVNSQLERSGDVGGRAFGQVREEIMRVAHESGVMANQVALVTRQLAGAFADESGTPDFGRALTEASSAFELSRVTGLPQQEITDSLTAVSLAFQKTGEDGAEAMVPFEEIGDTIIGLEERFGVLAPEIVKFTADLAPLGAELGFTVTQLSALGAVAQQVSGRTGAALSEQFGRILPALADRSSDLLLLFQENTETARQIPQLSAALASRDLPAVLSELVKGYDSFTDAQRNNLVSLVGSRREAAAFYALLARGPQTLDALQLEPETFTGAQQERFDEFSEKVQFAFEQAQRAVEEFGATLFEAGLADVLYSIGRGLDFVASGANGVLQPILALNDATDGWITKTAALAVGLLALNKALLAVAAGYRLVGASATVNALRSPGSFLGRGPVYGPPTPPGLGGPGQGAAPGQALFRGGQSFLGVGGATGGFLRANAPGLILMAGAAAKTIRDQGAKDIETAVDYLRSETRKALESGADPAEIAQIAEQHDQRLGVFDRALLWVSGQPTSGDVTGREIREFQAEFREKQIRAALEWAEEQGTTITEGGVDTQGMIPAVRDKLTLTPEFLDRFKEDPNKYTDEAIKFLAAASDLDADLAAELDGYAEDFNTGIREAAAELRASEAAARQLSDPDRVLSTVELRSAVETGSATPTALIRRLQEDIRLSDRLIAETRRAAAASPPEEQAELVEQLQGLLDSRAALVEEIEELAGRAITDPGDLRIRIRSALNLPDADEQNLGEVRAMIAGLEDLDPEEQLDRVFEGIELLRSIAEAAGETTFEIPPEFQRILAEAQIPALVESETGERIAQLLGTSIASLSEQLVAAIRAVGLDGERISAALIAARRGMLERALRATYDVANFRLRTARIDTITGQLADLDELEALLGSLAGDIVGSVETGATGYTGSETDPDDLARRIAEARIAVAQARANGDPVRLAQLAIQSADVQARFAKDQAESLQALAARIEAQNQLRDAQDDIGAAYGELAQAMNANDAVAATSAASQAAAAAVGRARGAAAQIRARAEQVNADRAARDAVRDVFTAQQELLLAVANAAGDTVEAASIQLGLARANLEALASEGGGGAELDRARAEIVAAEAAIRDARFQDQLGDIDFLLDMERISIQQAIRMLEAMMKIPTNTEEMTRDLERRIRSLRDELGRDFQFNLPSDIAPTLYEGRRFNQNGAANYQDNRTITMEFNAHNVEDAEKIFDQIVDEFNRPPRFGTTPRAF